MREGIEGVTDLQQAIAGRLYRVESYIDRLKRRLWLAAGRSQQPVIVPYRSYGHGSRLLVMGRVLQARNVTAGLAEDNVWHNLLNTYRRLESDEIPGARILASYGDMSAEAESDEEGYFRIWLQDVAAAAGWQDVELHLLAGAMEDEAPVQARAHVLVPEQGARFGVISDIDDTVMLSHATELIRMARLTFLGNARTRLPFPGVAAFYRALQRSISAQPANPIFYVSSSPWNLYDLLEEFFALQHIPSGPMFLRDWGVTAQEFLPTNHSDHKLQAIESLFNFYQALPFILIGDSGQQDPEIYAEVVRRHAGRVLAVYIRDVSEAAARDDAVRALAQEVNEAGSTLILAENTLAMARHAVERGWIEDVALNEIAGEVQSNLADDEPVV